MKWFACFCAPRRRREEAAARHCAAEPSRAERSHVEPDRRPALRFAAKPSLLCERPKVRAQKAGMNLCGADADGAIWSQSAAFGGGARATVERRGNVNAEGGAGRAAPATLLGGAGNIKSS